MAKIAMSTQIAASADKVWDVLKDFNGLPGWLPVVLTSSLEGDGVGCVRRLGIDGGGEVVERLDASDDAGRTCTYSIIESPFPFSSYQAIMTVKETGATACEFHWSCEVEPDGASEQEVVGILEGLYNSGFDGLKKALGV